MGKKGFTLVEVLIVSLFLVTVIVSILYFLNYTLYLNEVSRNSVVALNDACSVVENIKNIDPFSAANLLAVYPDGGVIAGFSNLNSESVQIDYANLAGDPIVATVTVSWQGKDRTRTESISTLITKR